jgi:hypothetical protein
LAGLFSVFAGASDFSAFSAFAGASALSFAFSAVDADAPSPPLPDPFGRLSVMYQPDPLKTTPTG